MPCDYKHYPKNWKTEIVPSVLKRAGEVREGKKIIDEAKCEWCEVENHSVFTMVNGEKIFLKRFGEMNFYLCPDGYKRMIGKTGEWRLVKIILTVAHLDHDKHNEDVPLDRLAALCQKCHLNYDRERHMENARKTRLKKKGLQELF